ncbi:MAG: hypothetical protein PHC51_04965 [bacterium]|nr:hypothetical protein [bacterium]
MIQILRPLSLAGITLSALFLSLMLLRETFLGDPGVGWHLETGHHILSSRELPITDLLPSISVGKKWVADQWLSDVIGYALVSSGGVIALHFAVSLVFLFICYPLMPWAFFRLRIGGAVSLFFSLTLVSVMISMQSIARPVIVSFLFFSIVCNFLFVAHRGALPRRRLWLLLPVFLLWVQMHPAFILGLMLVCLEGVFFVVRVMAQRSKPVPMQVGIIEPLFFPMVVLLTVFVSPYGFRLLESAVSLGQSRYFMQLNSEWHSPVFYELYYWPFYLAFFLLLQLAMLKSAVRLDLFQWVVVGFFAFMSFQHRRYIPFFAITAFLPLSVLFDECVQWVVRGSFGFGKAIIRLERRQYGLWGSQELLFSFVLASVIGMRDPAMVTTGSVCDWPNARVPDLTHVAPLVGDERIYNTPDLGGVLVDCSAGRQKYFIDDRNSLHEPELYEDFFSIYSIGPRWREVAAGHRLNWFLLDNNEPLSLVLQSSSETESFSAGKNFRLFHLR